jgi:hypothetical protein
VLSTIGELSDLDLSAVEGIVGPRSFGRGRDYARGNRVLAIEWDADTNTLTGSVVGRGALYDTAAFFTSDGRLGTAGIVPIIWRWSVSCMRCTARAKDRPPTTTATALTRHSISARVTACSCGRCWTRRIDSRRLRLVRLARSAPETLQRMVLGGEQLSIPAGELQRFAEELYPALRNVATVVSSDGSFTPPEISAPTLVLRASYGAGHAVDVGWEWAYRVGGATRRAPLARPEGGPGFRDVEAERTLLAGADFAGTDLERLGLLDGAGRPADGHPVSVGASTACA